MPFTDQPPVPLRSDGAIAFDDKWQDWLQWFELVFYPSLQGLTGSFSGENVLGDFAATGSISAGDDLQVGGIAPERPSNYGPTFLMGLLHGMAFQVLTNNAPGAGQGGVYLSGGLRTRADGVSVYTKNGVGATVLVLGDYDQGGFAVYADQGGIEGAEVPLTQRIRLDTTPTLAWRPVANNAMQFGIAGARIKEIFAVTGTINTSDARDKTPVTQMAPNEIAAALQLGREIGWFKFLDAVAEKGDANARRHVGMTVQRAIEVMTSHGLDPMAWGFICHDEWDERPATASSPENPFPDPGLPGGDKYSFRESELHGFILRGVLADRDTLAARITALEAA